MLYIITAPTAVQEWTVIQMNELWKPVKGFEGEYEVSNFGRVKSLDTIQRRSNGRVMCDFKIKGKILKPFRTGKGDGYYTVSIHGKFYKVHRLVATAFVPNPCNLPQVNHIDGDKTNNSVNNLEWVTNLENMQHAVRKGLRPLGGKVPNAKFTNEQVQEIRKEYEPNIRGKGIKALAKKYGVAYSTIKNILYGRKWKYVD